MASWARRRHAPLSLRCLAVGRAALQAQRAPHKVLGVPVGASPAAVKARFRALAKLHHPDVQPMGEESQLQAAARMAELVEAYDALMDDDLADRLQDNAVAASCEAFTVEELAAGGLYDVFALRLLLDTSLLSDGVHPDTAASASPRGAPSTPSGACELVGVASADGGGVAHVVANLDDSILDLKRALQHAHGPGWGLTGRRRDRHGLASGWELVFRGSALSYHLFIHDYGLGHGDLIHAVVRRGLSE